jgi:TetR/AcrR family transcriptional regulator, transcriptional repressor of aconitase
VAVPKVSQEHLDARREEILEGARRAFARHGYEGATVARLEEEIGVSRGAIFHYFPDKWSLFYELAARDQHELLTMLVEQGIDATLRHLTTENPDWMAVYMEVTRHLRTNPELMEDFRHRGGEELQARAREWLTSLHAEGTFRSDVSLDDVVAFINIVANGAALARALRLELDPESLVTLVHTGIDPVPQ